MLQTLMCAYGAFIKVYLCPTAHATTCGICFVCVGIKAKTNKQHLQTHTNLLFPTFNLSFSS